MVKVRFHEIDMLRGIGIFFIILIHAASYFLRDKTAFVIWNFSQFAVPVFVFCSTYLFFQKRNQYIKTSYFSYVRKRLYRLLKPYYVFLLFYLPLTHAATTESVVGGAVLREITLTTRGTEINWAVLLFVYVAALMPFLLFLYRKLKPLFFMYVILSLASCILLLFRPLPFNFRLTMWLPWSIIILYSWFFVRLENRRWFYPFAILAPATAFLATSFFLRSRDTSLIFFANKYPPNLHFLSYGVLSTSLLFLLAKHGLFKFAKRPINYLSRHSYSIFFIHLWLIVFAAKFFDIRALQWWQFFAVILVSTVLIQSLSGGLLRILRAVR